MQRNPKIMKKSNIDYTPIIAKYKTGEYSVRELAKMFDIPRSTLIDYIKKNDIQISQEAKEAIKSLDNGLNILTKISGRNNANTVHPTISQNAGLDSVLKQDTVRPKISGQVDNFNTLVTSEVIDIVKRRHPQFASSLTDLGSLIIQRGIQFLTQEDTQPKDLKDIANAMESVNKTLQVIPSTPAIAQQFNFNKEIEKEKGSFENEKIPIEIRIVDKPLDNDS